MVDLSSVVMGVVVTHYHQIPPVWPHQRYDQVFNPDPVYDSPHKVSWGGSFGVGGNVSVMNAPITDPPFVFYLTVGVQLDLFFFDAVTHDPVSLKNIDLRIVGRSYGDPHGPAWPTMAVSAPIDMADWSDRDDLLSSRTIQAEGNYQYYYMGPDDVVPGVAVYREYETIRSFLPHEESSHLTIRHSTAICWKCFDHYGPGYYEQGAYDLHNRPYDSFTSLYAGLKEIELLGFTPIPDPDPPDRRRRAAWLAGAGARFSGALSGEMRGI